MAKKYLPLVILMILVAATVATMQSQDGKTVLNAAVKAMGVENLKTIQLSGSGSTAGIGQNINPNNGWPTVYVKSYVRQIDLDAGASNLQLVRVQNGVDTPQTVGTPANASWDLKFDFWVT